MVAYLGRSNSTHRLGIIYPPFFPLLASRLDPTTPGVPVRLHLLLAISFFGISASLEHDKEISILIQPFVLCSIRVLRRFNPDIITVHGPLRYQDQLCENCRMPLYNVFKSMKLSLLKVIGPIQRVEPSVQQVVTPLIITQEERGMG